MVKNKKTVKRVIDCIFYFFIIIVFVISVMNVIATKSGKQPSIFGYSTFYIMTGSMEPTIPVGSLVIDKLPKGSSISKGDVITFKGENTITTHRVYEVIDGGKEFITKGDANNTVDPGTRNINQILGIVKWHIPYLGNIIQFIKNNVIIVFASIIFIFIIANIIGKDKKKNN